ncbi:MAG TPA: phosphoribosyltransferase family protein [Demequinaceae bacterium]
MDASREPGTLAVVAAAVARAIVPVVCPGCGLPDVRWCGDCAAVWWEPPYRSESGAGRLDVLGRAPLPAWSIVPLVGPPHLMIGAWKDGGRRDLDPFFRDAMIRAVASLAGALEPITVVVPVPARPASTRRRGVDLPGLLADAAASALARTNGSVLAARCLRNSGREARGLGSRARWSGSAIGLDPGSAPAGRTALLVDDVVTTGASLARSCEALERAGVAVAAAVTLAATLPPGTNRDLGP